MTKFVIACALFIALVGVPAAQNDYRIGAQDILNITVFGEPDLSGRFTVEQDGTFTFPLVGRVKAGGVTLRGLEQDLSKQLADGFLKSPQVTVVVETYKSQRVLILGEVRAPGEFQLTSDMTLMAALARAGSPTPAAGHEVVIVRPRHPAPGTKPIDPRIIRITRDDAPPSDADIIRVDLTDLQAGNIALNMMLQDGDTVTVPKAQSVFITGEVKAPGAHNVDRGTTVLQVLSLAGGLTDRGADGRIRIQRTVKGKRTEIKAKLTDVVQPGDTIIVPSKFF